ncbi:MAG: haloacid dehalogenase-like hydrolase [Ruminococcaceae bacterium]|nr:haloacid dehalogenase-like hydrolase [Oscillospiraceae bacterium]
MNCYDFDKTIYKSDSSCDFYLFCLKHYPKILRRLPVQAFAFFRYYVLHNITKTQMKEVFYRYFRDIPDMDETLARFWKKHLLKMQPFYAEKQQEDDVIISASPEFFLKPACDALGIRHLMASPVDPKTGKYNGENCHGKEKVKRFRAVYPNASVEEFYSDSLSDTPMAELAKKAFLVKGSAIKEWPKQ